MTRWNDSDDAGLSRDKRGFGRRGPAYQASWPRFEQLKNGGSSWCQPVVDVGITVIAIVAKLAAGRVTFNDNNGST